LGQVSRFHRMYSRFYFNLTNDEDVICDDVGALVSDIYAALTYALEILEELRTEDPLAEADSFAWRVEITDHAGQVLESLSLDEPLSTPSSR
jgi:hypothetical protein